MIRLRIEALDKLPKDLAFGYNKSVFGFPNWVCFLCLAMEVSGAAFTPPNSDERMAAIGNTNGLSAQMCRALNPQRDFRAIHIPGPDDWLTEHKEKGQRFKDFVNFWPNKPDSTRKVIYLQPIGAFEADKSPDIRKLKEYATAFFQIPVKLLPPLDLVQLHITERLNPQTHNRQLLTRDLQRELRRSLPDDAFCLLGITMIDLYPDPTYNFVFGEASLTQRAGVFSFARYDPFFYGQQRGPDCERILLKRSCKVLAHETAHMFALQHCIYFECALNGSNHLQESDNRPMELCPVCLHKLYESIGFDVVKRYKAVKTFCEKEGFSSEAAWMQKRIGWIESRKHE